MRSSQVVIETRTEQRLNERGDFSTHNPGGLGGSCKKSSSISLTIFSQSVASGNVPNLRYSFTFTKRSLQTRDVDQIHAGVEYNSNPKLRFMYISKLKTIITYHIRDIEFSLWRN